MRSYPLNSPRAAARLVALVMIADGHVCSSEIAALRDSGAEPALGLRPGEFGTVMQALCEDLLTVAESPSAFPAVIDAAFVQALAREVDDPLLQLSVLHAAELTVAADGHRLAEESQVLSALFRAWQIPETEPELRLAA